MQSTGDSGWARLDGRDNALNAIRLALALMVIVGHAYVLGYGTQPPVPDIHGRAVDGFFVISGYLIAASRTRLPLGAFAWRRALRIYPGLWVCLLVTALVIAPVTALLTGEQWSIAEAGSFITGNGAAFTHQWNIGDTLGAVPYPGVWNGSLWSLAYELGCYAGLAAIFALTRHRTPVVAAVLIACSVLMVADPAVMHLYVVQLAVRLAGFFAAGALVYLLRDRLRCSAVVAAAAGAATVGLALLGERAFWAVAPMLLAYSLLVLGARLRVRVGQRNDISYGMYIYAFPVQQVLVVVGVAAAPAPVFVVVSMAATAALAWPSWLLVERPALRLRLPRQSSGVIPATTVHDPSSSFTLSG